MRWKWIFGTIGGIILAFIVSVYIILSRYNFNYLKPQIIKAAREATGRELTLGGDVNLRISLTPALTVDRVSFQNAVWGSRPQMATITRLVVQVALLPLLPETSRSGASSWRNPTS